MTDFFRTRMGATFFERTLPELVRQLTRIADLMERLIDQAAAERIATPVERKPEEEE